MLFTLFTTLAVANTASVATVATDAVAVERSTPAPVTATLKVAEAPAEEDASVQAQSIERVVKNYFADIPVLAEVARCESSFRHTDKNGDIIRGVVNDADVGVMQINEYYHLDLAEKLGYDLYNVEGNMAFAKYLYDKYGTEPWSASQPCWGAEARKIEADSNIAKN